ncbi:PIN-like domain-containing protein [Nocardia rhamnosiphila]
MVTQRSSAAPRRFTEEFSAWIDHVEPEHKRFFDEGLVVVDTNVLLDLYRVSATTRSEILEVLTKISSRLWIPHQVATEYSRNRKQAVYDRKANFSNIRNSLKASESAAISKLNTALDKFVKFREKNRSVREWKPSEHGLGEDDISQKIKGIWKAALEEIDALEEEINLDEKSLSSDDILARLDDLLTGRVGPAFSPQELQQHVEHAVNFRYPNEIPPGYADIGKGTPLRVAGDYLVWRQLINHVNASAEPGKARQVMLVTGDFKEDWWVLDGAGAPKHARPELIQEMRQEAGSELLIISLTSLLRGAKEYLDFDVSEQAISEVEEQEFELESLLPSFLLSEPGKVALTDIHPRALESVVKYLFLRSGYVVQSVEKGSSAARADLVVKDKNGRLAAVEVAGGFARGASSRKSLRQLQNTVHAVEEYSGRRAIGIFVTPVTLAEVDRKFAEYLNLLVLDGSVLVSWLASFGVYVSPEDPSMGDSDEHEAVIASLHRRLEPYAEGTQESQEGP